MVESRFIEVEVLMTAQYKVCFIQTSDCFFLGGGGVINFYHHHPVTRFPIVMSRLLAVVKSWALAFYDIWRRFLLLEEGGGEKEIY